MGCKGEDKASMKAFVTGGYPPYEFDWPSEGIYLYEDPSVVLGLTDGEKSLTISDDAGCMLIKDFTVEAYPLPEIELNLSDSVVYYQKPYVTFSYRNLSYDSLVVDTFAISSFNWKFGDGDSTIVESPSHTYRDVGYYDIVFSYYTFYGCPGNDSAKVEVKPVDLSISSLITPNGDQKNDIFEVWDNQEDAGSGGDNLKNGVEGEVIDLGKYYISTSLVVFNRWGQKVFETENYRNDWDGENLVDGIYFYVLKCEGEYGEDVYKGSVMIISSSDY
jgi:hypothetical protein